MDRERLQERELETERNILEAKRHIARLHELMVELQRGYDIRLATKLLRQFEQRLATYTGERDLLRKELGLPAWQPLTVASAASGIAAQDGAGRKQAASLYYVTS
jgi:hypothetical protein